MTLQTKPCAASGAGLCDVGFREVPTAAWKHGEWGLTARKTMFFCTFLGR